MIPDFEGIFNINETYLVSTLSTGLGIYSFFQFSHEESENFMLNPVSLFNLHPY